MIGFNTIDLMLLDIVFDEASDKYLELSKENYKYLKMHHDIRELHIKILEIFKKGTMTIINE